jgi:hypothetical protein
LQKSIHDLSLKFDRLIELGLGLASPRVRCTVPLVLVVIFVVKRAELGKISEGLENASKANVDWRPFVYVHVAGIVSIAKAPRCTLDDD